MQRNGALVHQITQSVGAVRERVHHGAVFLVHAHTPNPVREMLRNVLLNEVHTLNALREPVQRQRPALEMGQHVRCDAFVVVAKIGLAQVRAREEDFPRIVDLQIHGDCARSRPTSSAALSSRRPRKRGWRNLSSSVHSVKAISATSSGETQWTPDSRTRPEKGESARETLAMLSWRD